MPQSKSVPWPTLRSWTGDRASHPLRDVLDAADSGDDQQAAACAVWEELLQQVEQAAPNRWEGKRREFRQQRYFSETYGERCELVLAAWFARARVEFEFGMPGQAQPDLVLQQWGLGIEVSSRSLDGAKELEDDIRAVVEYGPGEPEHVQITFDYRPLAIRASVRQKIVDMVRRGLAVDEEVVPARAGKPAIGVRITRTPSDGPAVVESGVTSALLTPHLQDVVAEIQSKVIKDSRKIKQAAAVPTVLVVDISRCGCAWMRPLTSWAQALHGLLDEYDPYVAIAVMTNELSDVGIQFAWSANPHIEPDLAEHVSRLFSQLGAAG